MIDATEIPIITYHHILSDEEIIENQQSENIYTISTTKFNEQMKYLHDNGFKTATLDQLYQWYLEEKKLPVKTVVITFDDGYKSTVHHAVPILKQYEFTATNFVIGYRATDTHEAFTSNYLQFVTKPDIHDSIINETMQFYSHTFECHSSLYNKPKYLSYSKEEIINDLQKSSQVQSIDYLAYPFGASDEHVWEAAKEAGVKMAFSYSDNRYFNRTDNIMNTPRFSIASDMCIEDFEKIFEKSLMIDQNHNLGKK